LNPTSLASRELPNNMMAGRGKLRQTKKDKSPAREALPLRAPFDEFKLSPGLSSRRRSDADLLPGLPDKTPRARKDKSPLAKDPTTKDGTVEVPGLVSLSQKRVLMRDIRTITLVILL
jgi:hypothetical protein